MTTQEPIDGPSPSHLFTSSNGDHVPMEIIHHILSTLETQGQFRALCKIQQLSSAFHQLASPYLYRDVHIRPSNFIPFFQQFVRGDCQEGPLKLPLDYQSREYTSPISDLDGSEPPMKLGATIRMRYLFTMVRKITIPAATEFPSTKLYASSHLRDFLNSLNLLPNVETICISGSPSDPIPIDPRVELVCLSCRPKKICIKWLHEDYNIQEILDLLSHDTLEIIIVHGANKAFLPPAGKYSVRMSLAVSQNQLADQVMRVGAYAIIKASESLRSEECGKWRIVGNSREGSTVEDSQAIQEMLEDVEPLIDELPEDEWWEETLRKYEAERLGNTDGPEVRDINGEGKEKTMSLRERARALMSILSYTRAREEEENEPPCEVCGERLSC